MNFRLSEEGEALTGFKRGGLCPWGSETKVVMVVDQDILGRLPEGDQSIWLGGGEIDVKLNVSWQALETLQPFHVSLTAKKE